MADIKLPKLKKVGEAGTNVDIPASDNPQPNPDKKTIDYVKNRNNSVEKIISNFEYKNQKKSYLIYIDDYKDDDKFYNYFTYVNDNFDFRHQLPSLSKNTLMGTSVNIHKYCNRLYWDSHFNSYIIWHFNFNWMA